MEWFSLDEKHGIVFAPTGSASFDFYGGKRRGDNLFANTLLALRCVDRKTNLAFSILFIMIFGIMIFPRRQHWLQLIKMETKLMQSRSQLKQVLYLCWIGKQANQFIPLIEKPVPHISELGEYLSATQPYAIHSKTFCSAAHHRK